MLALAVFGGIIGISLLIALSSIFNGYTLSILWEWFIVPVFGLPQLSVAPAIGIALVIGYLTHQSNPDVEEKERETSEKVARVIATSIVRPLFVLLFGWVVHLFM